MTPAPPTQPTDRAHTLLVEFLKDHDAPCPVCRYNLRGLGQPVCPECKQDLTLTIGSPRIRLGWLLITLAPGCFSGIAACFMVLPTMGVYVEDGVIIPPFAWAVLFGWSSGLYALTLALRRNRFIGRSARRQRWTAFLVWAVHIAALGIFIVLLAPHFS